jgi:hypothetical protein
MVSDLYDDTLNYLWDSKLDPLFWCPERLGAVSAWWGHVPFAHWIVSAARPRLLVELGTETGVSYAAFCETVVRKRLNVRCLAVDTWKGDLHTGSYAEEVYRDFRQFHDDRYQGFSTLLRCTFDAALEYVADRSVDFLHIDGLHTYEVVKHDFETWQPKLSDHAVVLFHDINTRDGDFGVWRLWSELRDRFPSFEFLHCYGLGVCAVGGHVPSAVAALCALDDPNAVAAVRERFARLGERWMLDLRERTIAQQLAAREAHATPRKAEARSLDEALRRGETDGRRHIDEAMRARDEALHQLEAESRLRLEAAQARDAAIHESAIKSRLRLEAVQERDATLHQLAIERRLRLEAERARDSALHQSAAEGRLRLEAVRARAEAEGEAVKAQANYQAMKAEYQASAAETERLRSILARATAELQATLTSTSWRATLPFRVTMDVVRGGTKLVRWSLKPSLPGKTRERHREFDYVPGGTVEGYKLQSKAPAEKDATSGDVLGSRLQEMVPIRETDKEISQIVDLSGSQPAPVSTANETDGSTTALPATGQAEQVPTLNEVLCQRFGSLKPLRSYIVRGGPKRITMVTDSINVGLLYGGVGTAIILCTLLAERMRVNLRLVTRAEAAVAENFGVILATNGIQWSDNIEFVYSPADHGREVQLTSDDLLVTTSWWTTRSTKHAVDPSHIIYLLQEDERIFYAHGDDRLRCAETLAEPDIRFVVNSELLFEHLTTGPEALQNIKTNGIWFEPAFPTSQYYRDPSPRANGKRNFFFYARPHNLRNLYWRGLEAIGAAIEEGILQPQEWNLCFVGRDLSDVALPRGARPQILQSLPWPEYAALIRQMDLGLSLMDSPHASYPPLDLAASGAVVVTNRHGLKTSLSRYSDNILCVEPTVEGLKRGIAEGIRLATNDSARAANYARNRIPRDWRSAFEPVLQRLLTLPAG